MVIAIAIVGIALLETITNIVFVCYKPSQTVSPSQDVPLQPIPQQPPPEQVTPVNVVPIQEQAENFS